MNKEHLEILEKGIEYWNNWRIEFPRVNPDLSNITLSLTNPARFRKDVEYKMRDFSSGNFRKTNFSESKLLGANFTSCNLEKAIFKKADLRRANFAHANLSGVSFHQANLTLSNFYKADLNNALFWETIMARTSFLKSKNLINTRHGGPSVIDHRTFIKSGDLAEEFLYKIGLPKEIILSMNNFVKNRKSKSCFISHSSKDVKFVEKLYNDLQENDMNCWYAPEDLDIGDKTRDKIDKAIEDYDKLLIILSENSIESYWVEDEVEAAIDYEITNNTIKLLPIMIDKSVFGLDKPWFKKIKRNRNIGDFSDWESPEQYELKLSKLIKSINK